MKIAHLTSAHPRDDTRILLKQCRSLAAAGHEVCLVVADGKGDETRNGVRMLDAGRSTGRLARMAGATRRVLARASELSADVYHLHDPELLPAGLVLKWHGRRVVFDAHEDVPLQILTKPYLPAPVRRPVSAAFAAFERWACRRLDAVVAATPAIAEKFARIGILSVTINNYPLPSEFASVDSGASKGSNVCYAGGISHIRGIRELVAAMAICAPEVRLLLAGNFDDEALRAEVAAQAGWRRVVEHGFLARSELAELLAGSVAGIVTFLPSPNHVAAQPNKLFEYMAAGIAVIASDFPLWREIVEGGECGLCVDPRDPGAIAAAIDSLVANPDEAHRMGANGRRAVEARYNWAAEEEKLLTLYRALETGSTIAGD